MRKLSLIGIKDSTPSCHVFRRSLRPSDIRECREQSEEIEDKDGLRRVVKTAKGQGPRKRGTWFYDARGYAVMYILGGTRKECFQVPRLLHACLASAGLLAQTFRRVYSKGSAGRGSNPCYVTAGLSREIGDVRNERINEFR